MSCPSELVDHQAHHEGVDVEEHHQAGVARRPIEPVLTLQQAPKRPGAVYGVRQLERDHEPLDQ